MRAVNLMSVCALSAMASVALASTALAQSLPKEGKFEYVACFAGVSNVLNFSEKHGASSWDLAGTILAQPPGGFFDKTTFRCVGATSRVEGKAFARYSCEVTDPDGAKVFSHYINEDGKTTRMANIGTGKYEGLELASTLEPITGFPQARPGTIQGCNRQSGTYKLKVTN